MAKKNTVDSKEDAVVAPDTAQDTGIQFEVSDPEVLRPRELPLVIKPTGGSWANEAQARYAQVLNGYAYKNAKKWNKKKDALLAQLKRLENEPELIDVLTGSGGDDGKLTFKNKLIQS